MITTIITETQSRPNWRGETKTIRSQRTQIEGTVTAIDETPVYEGSRQVTRVHHIDAGDQTVTVEILTQLARTADGTERGLPQVGERVRIFAEAAAKTDYRTGISSSEVTVL